jgi:hypothetical protein
MDCFTITSFQGIFIGIVLFWPGIPAIRTFPLMHAKELAAPRTGPLCLFGLQEFLDAKLPDHRQVLDGADAIPGPIAPIQVTDPFTGIFRTGVAEIQPFQIVLFAVFDFTFDAHSGFIQIVTPAAMAWLALSDICPA